MGDLNAIVLRMDRREIELNNMKSGSQLKNHNQSSDHKDDLQFHEENLQASCSVYLESFRELIGLLPPKQQESSDILKRIYAGIESYQLEGTRHIK